MLAGDQDNLPPPVAEPIENAQGNRWNWNRLCKVIGVVGFAGGITALILTYDHYKEHLLAFLAAVGTFALSIVCCIWTCCYTCCCSCLPEFHLPEIPQIPQIPSIPEIWDSIIGNGVAANQNAGDPEMGAV